MTCRICGSSLHKTKSCPKRSDFGDPDETVRKTTQAKTKPGNDNVELPEYAEVSETHYRAGGG